MKHVKDIRNLKAGEYLLIYGGVTPEMDIPERSLYIGRFYRDGFDSITEWVEGDFERSWNSPGCNLFISDSIYRISVVELMLFGDSFEK